MHLNEVWKNSTPFPHSVWSFVSANAYNALIMRKQGVWSLNLFRNLVCLVLLIIHGVRMRRVGMGSVDKVGVGATKAARIRIYSSPAKRPVREECQIFFPLSMVDALTE